MFLLLTVQISPFSRAKKSSFHLLFTVFKGWHNPKHVLIKTQSGQSSSLSARDKCYCTITSSSLIFMCATPPHIFNPTYFDRSFSGIHKWQNTYSAIYTCCYFYSINTVRVKCHKSLIMIFKGGVRPVLNSNVLNSQDILYSPSKRSKCKPTSIWNLKHFMSS